MRAHSLLDVACGPARWFAGEVTQVVVVGGTQSFEKNAPATSIVEIYMVKANKWTTGNRNVAEYIKWISY